MDVVATWTGRHASALRTALRMSNESFANHLGVAVRTVAKWEADPDIVLTPTLQATLDTALSHAADDARRRFALILTPPDHQPVSSPTGGLRVAIAVVIRETSVLLVRRRERSGDLSWQFPAGIVKPEKQREPADIAVDETFNETGVHCAATRQLGSRIHPVTGAPCDYFLCDYLSGVAENRDPVENSAVAWSECVRVGDYIPVAQIFQPVREALDEVAKSTAPIAAAIIVRGRTVLLVKRRVQEEELSWQFPAGKILLGESPEEGAVRETNEETGLTVRPVKVIGERIHPATRRRMFYVACEPVQGTAHLTDTEELSDVIWCPVEKLAEYIPAGIFPPVLDYLENPTAK